MAPMDGSLYAQLALNWAIQHLVQPNDELILIHVRSTLDHKPSQCLLLNTARKLLANNLHNITAISCMGEPGETLVTEINALKPDLVLVSFHGLGGKGKKEMGSVSRYLVKNAKRPLLVVPTSS